MKQLAGLVLVPAIALMMGCGQSRTFSDSEGNEATVSQKGDTTEVNIQSAEGEVQYSSDATGVELPEDFPEDIPLYPDALITTVANAPQGSLVGLEVKATPAEVMTFYEQELAADGWEISVTTKTAEGGFFGAQKGERGLALAIAAGEDITTINLTTKK
ncbi:MAG: hypothetical protein F6K04_05735 [Leptolyngbya sp. SIO4C5]|uniref:hypothetical protein n=1 Tax=Sphaerothrix gracilis TaxID=3151835 RepID=UPI0013C15819|nr:hypothetical protein [Leptolyngbya sp. SIO4C5]